MGVEVVQQLSWPLHFLPSFHDVYRTIFGSTLEDIL